MSPYLSSALLRTLPVLALSALLTGCPDTKQPEKGPVDTPATEGETPAPAPEPVPEEPASSAVTITPAYFPGGGTAEGGAVGFLRFDDYVPNETGLNGTVRIFQGTFTGFAAPDSPALSAHGVLVSTPLGKVRFADGTSAAVTSDIDGNTILLRFVEPARVADTSLEFGAAAVSKVGFHLVGTAVQKNEAVVTLIGPEGSEIDSIKPNSGGRLAAAFAFQSLDGEGRPVPAIHAVKLSVEGDGYLMLGTGSLDNTLPDLVYEDLTPLGRPVSAIALQTDGLEAPPQADIVLDPRLTEVRPSPRSWYLPLGGDRWIALRGNFVLLSEDAGQKWTSAGSIYSGGDAPTPGSLTAARTADGTIVAIYMDTKNSVFGYDSASHRLSDASQLNVWMVRSEDDGKTWAAPEQITEGLYVGATTDMLATSQGTLLAPLTVLRKGDATCVIKLLRSEDGGGNWEQITFDLGGRGHHDGAMEPTLVELADGSILMLIRTTQGAFFAARSDDDGRTWSEPESTGIAASSSPGFLRRLADGRLVLLYNPLVPEGASPEAWAERPFGYRGEPFSEQPASWHREELALTFSADNGKTWSKPEVVARLGDGGWLSYPNLFQFADNRVRGITLFNKILFENRFLPVPNLEFEFDPADFPTKDE